MAVIQCGWCGTFYEESVEQLMQHQATVRHRIFMFIARFFWL